MMIVIFFKYDDRHLNRQAKYRECAGGADEGQCVAPLASVMAMYQVAGYL
jgi:hypothetical protein